MEMYLKKWHFKDFVKVVLPSIITMLFTSFFTIADGYFVARGVGPEALAAVNIVMPITSLFFGISIMFAVGGSTLASIKMGENKPAVANQNFSLTIVAIASISITTTLLLSGFIDNVIIFLGATEQLISYSHDYLTIMNITMPFFMLKIAFEFFTRADGRPDISLISTIIGGVANVIFDYFFVMVFGWGIAGAAYGTLLGVTLSVIVSLAYFIFAKSKLKFVKPHMDWKFISAAAINGSSELVSEFSMGITTFLFNIIILKYAQEAGISAISVILYLNFIIVSIFLGFNMGIQPVISYNFGAGNTANIKNILKKSLFYIIILSVFSYSICFIFGDHLVQIFLNKNTALFDLTKTGLLISATSFLLCGINLFVSAYFTAINNGKYSAMISFSRSLLFLCIGLLVLPLFFDIKGVWLALPFAEVLTLILSVYLLSQKNDMVKYSSF